MKNLTKKVISATLLALPSLGFAQGVIPSPNVPVTGVRSLDDVSRILVTLVNWVTGLFFVAAILFLFYAAYLYLGAAGDPERLTKAKDQLIYSVIAIAVALLAGSVRFIVESILR
ncbi:MAG: pilin [bacterium]|nr:pilin [bacterium]